MKAQELPRRMGPTPQQRRILQMMINGDLVWEVLDKTYRSIYNEKKGHDQRVARAVVDEMEEQGWIRKQPNPNAARLDGWELTEPGRALAAQLVKRKKKNSA
jgi:hypothetical protein